MPKLTSFADVVTDLERLLAAANANEAMLPGVETLKTPLGTAIAEMRALATRRDTLNADKQVLSADLKAAMQRGRDLGVQFRAFARAHVGMRSEKMVEFRVPVRRLGVPRKKRGGEPFPAARRSAPQAPSGVAVAASGPPSGEGGVNGQG